jgi:hypothetical protein
MTYYADFKKAKIAFQQRFLRRFCHSWILEMAKKHPTTFEREHLPKTYFFMLLEEAVPSNLNSHYGLSHPTPLDRRPVGLVFGGP